MTTTLRSRLLQILDLQPVAQPPLDTPDDDAFARHARALTTQNLKLAALVLFAASAASWAADPLVYCRAPEIAARLTWLRACHTLSTAGLYLALRFTPAARHPNAVTLIVTAVDCVAIGWGTGLLGDLGTPWFHFSYAAAISMLIPVIALRRRALYGFVYAAGLATGYEIARPGVPPPPMLIPTVSFLLLVTVAAVSAGHVVFRLIRQGFVSARARDRAARELKDLNKTLARRVRHQTRDLSKLAAHLEGAREEERSRIARELHDELGQELTALRYTLTFLRQRFDRDPSSIRVNLDELELLLSRTATTTRQIVSDLRPKILDDLGLDAGVEWLLKRTEERAGLACRLATQPRKLDLDVEISIAAFRILQESLTNVVKHARATRVEVELIVEDGELALTVRDDGIGMADEPLSEPLGAATPPPRAPGTGGMGLIGMRERVDSLGGDLRIESGPGEGTTVRVRLPAAVPNPHPLAESVS